MNFQVFRGTSSIFPPKSLDQIYNIRELPVPPNLEVVVWNEKRKHMCSQLVCFGVCEPCNGHRPAKTAVKVMDLKVSDQHELNYFVTGFQGFSLGASNCSGWLLRHRTLRLLTDGHQLSCRSRSQIFYCPVQSPNSMKSKVLLLKYNFLSGHFFIRSSTKMLWQIMKKKSMRSDFIVIAWVDRPVSEWSEFLIFCDRVWIRAQKDCVLAKLPWCILPNDSYPAPVVSG